MAASNNTCSGSLARVPLPVCALAASSASIQPATVPGIAIKPRRRLGAGAARALDGAHAAGRLADQPEAVAADVVRVRIDRGNPRGHRQHRFDGVAAFGEDGAAVLYRGGMRRTDDAAAMAGAMQVHAGTASASPRFFNSASTVGRRPRKAL